MVALGDIDTLMRYLDYQHPTQPYYGKSVTQLVDFSFVEDPPWEGTVVEVDEQWARVRDERVLPIPSQGWKIHVSTTLENAEHTLRIAGEYCVANQLTWKFIRSPAVLFERNSKYGDRSASGKFVTIYPPTVEVLGKTLLELGELLQGLPSPYILSDLRWRSGPLYVRYGGFARRQMRLPTGQIVDCIEDPDGNLVVDERRPSFRPPAWVEIPPVLQTALADRAASSLDDFPYSGLQALHFSNGGGVYVGTADASGDRVALREARPSAGLDFAGTDAVARLERERWALESLADVSAVPNLIDYRRGHEHYFLIREFAEGANLAQLRSWMNPTLFRGERSREDYAAWAEGVVHDISESLAQIHECGVVFGDLHPGNILVDEDGRVSLIDFESAKPVGDSDPQRLAGPGYRAPPELTGPDIDRFALGRLRIGLFVPIESTFDWVPGKVDQAIDYMASTFPLSEDFIRQTRLQTSIGGSDRGIQPELSDFELSAPGSEWNVDAGIEPMLSSLVDGILQSVDRTNSERPFPGDPAQFLLPLGGFTMAYGSAGVLWALLVTGYDPPDELLDSLSAGTAELTEGPLGFYDGLAGVAYLLAKAGRREAADRLVERHLVGIDPSGQDQALGSGIAGIALSIFGIADALDWPEIALESERLTEAMLAVDPRNVGMPGLLQGSAGLALCLLDAYERTGERTYLEATRGHLVHAVNTLRAAATDGSLSRQLPTLIRGNGGVGLVIERYLQQDDDAELHSAAAELVESTEVPFNAQGGLFDGLAGIMAARSGMLGAAGPHDPLVAEQLRSLALHGVTIGGRLATLGPFGIRLSSDLATGSAGTLLALHAVASNSVVALPFLNRGH